MWKLNFFLLLIFSFLVFLTSILSRYFSSWKHSYAYYFPYTFSFSLTFLSTFSHAFYICLTATFCIPLLSFSPFLRLLRKRFTRSYIAIFYTFSTSFTFFSFWPMVTLLLLGQFFIFIVIAFIVSTLRCSNLWHLPICTQRMNK